MSGIVQQNMVYGPYLALISGSDHFLESFLQLSNYLFLKGLPEQVDCSEQFLQHYGEIMFLIITKLGTKINPYLQPSETF